MVTEELIEACIRKDTKAQYALYRQLYPLMMSITTRYITDQQQAGEAMNRGFLKIFQHLADRKPDVPFVAWARRVMINETIDRIRREKKHQHTVEITDHLPDVDLTSTNEYLKTMAGEAVAALLDHLPPMSRTVMNLFAVDGWSHAEIAEHLEISESTSKWHVHHARKTLKHKLGELANTQPNTPSIHEQ